MSESDGGRRGETESSTADRVLHQAGALLRQLDELQRSGHLAPVIAGFVVVLLAIGVLAGTVPWWVSVLLLLFCFGPTFLRSWLVTASLLGLQRFAEEQLEAAEQDRARVMQEPSETIDQSTGTRMTDKSVSDSESVDA